MITERNKKRWAAKALQKTAALGNADNGSAGGVSPEPVETYDTRPRIWAPISFSLTMD